MTDFFISFHRYKKQPLQPWRRALSATLALALATTASPPAALAALESSTLRPWTSRAAQPDAGDVATRLQVDLAFDELMAASAEDLPGAIDAMREILTSSGDEDSDSWSESRHLRNARRLLDLLTRVTPSTDATGAFAEFERVRGRTGRYLDVTDPRAQRLPYYAYMESERGRVKAHRMVDVVMQGGENIFLLDARLPGRPSVVRLGFIERTRPVGLWTLPSFGGSAEHLPAFTEWLTTFEASGGGSITETLRPRVEALEGGADGVLSRFLNLYARALALDQMSLVNLHGLWIDGDGLPNLVIDIRSGSRAVDDTELLKRDTISQAITLNERLAGRGLAMTEAFEFLVDRDGDLQHVDLDEIVARETAVDGAPHFRSGSFGQKFAGLIDAAHFAVAEWASSTLADRQAALFDHLEHLPFDAFQAKLGLVQANAIRQVIHDLPRILGTRDVERPDWQLLGRDVVILHDVLGRSLRGIAQPLGHSEALGMWLREVALEGLHASSTRREVWTREALAQDEWTRDVVPYVAMLTPVAQDVVRAEREGDASFRALLDAHLSAETIRAQDMPGASWQDRPLSAAERDDWRRGEMVLTNDPLGHAIAYQPSGDIGVWSHAAVGHPDRNEDVGFVDRRANGMTVMAVLDGQGGAAGGYDASRAAVAVFREILDALPDDASEAMAIDALTRAMREAHAAIRELPYPSAGTTATVAVTLPQADGSARVVIAEAGDTRVYAYEPDGTFEQLTLDNHRPAEGVDRVVLSRAVARRMIEASLQPLLSQVERRYTMTYEQNEAFKVRNKTDNTLKGDESYQVVIIAATVAARTRLLVTSDGIHDNLTDAEIQQEMDAHAGESTQVLSLALARRARQRADDESHLRRRDDDMTVAGADLLGADSDMPIVAALTADRAGATLGGADRGRDTIEPENQGSLGRPALEAWLAENEWVDSDAFRDEQAEQFRLRRTTVNRAVGRVSLVAWLGAHPEWNDSGPARAELRERFGLDAYDVRLFATEHRVRQWAEQRAGEHVEPTAVMLAAEFSTSTADEINASRVNQILGEFSVTTGAGGSGTEQFHKWLAEHPEWRTEDSPSFRQQLRRRFGNISLRTVNITLNRLTLRDWAQERAGQAVRKTLTEIAGLHGLNSGDTTVRPTLEEFHIQFPPPRRSRPPVTFEISTTGPLSRETIDRLNNGNAATRLRVLEAVVGAIGDPERLRGLSLDDLNRMVRSLLARMADQDTSRVRQRREPAIEPEVLRLIEYDHTGLWDESLTAQTRFPALQSLAAVVSDGTAPLSLRVRAAWAAIAYASLGFREEMAEALPDALAAREGAQTTRDVALTAIVLAGQAAYAPVSGAEPSAAMTLALTRSRAWLGPILSTVLMQQEFFSPDAGRTALQNRIQAFVERIPDVPVDTDRAGATLGGVAPDLPVPVAPLLEQRLLTSGVLSGSV